MDMFRCRRDCKVKGKFAESVCQSPANVKRLANLLLEIVETIINPNLTCHICVFGVMQNIMQGILLNNYTRDMCLGQSNFVK